MSLERDSTVRARRVPKSTASRMHAFNELKNMLLLPLTLGGVIFTSRDTKDTGFVP